MFQIPPIIIIAAVIAVCMLAVYAFTVVMAMLPSIVAVVLLGVLVKRKRPAWSPKAQIKGCGDFNGDAIAGVVVLLVAGVVIGQSITSMWPELVGIFDGDEMFKHLAGLILRVALAGVAFYVFNEINEGRVKMAVNIYDLVDDDKPGMDAFIAGESQPVFIDIVPDRDIPKIKEEVIGQDEIVEDTVKLVARRVRQNRPGKPLAVLMYVGSSGAGKSELAKALAKTCFGGRLITIAANTIKGTSEFYSLLGSPKGHVGSNTMGSLTGDIKKFRSGVILIDEFGRNIPEFNDVIMMLTDEGRIQEKSNNEFVDATKFVVIMTSNTEQKALADLMNKIQDKDDLNRAVRDTLQSTFEPAQLARINKISVFPPLDRKSLGLVAGKFLLKSAKSAEIELVGLSKQIMIDIIERQEKNSEYGMRNLMDMVEGEVMDQFFEAKDSGFNKAALRFKEDDKGNLKIIVVGVDDDGVEHSLAVPEEATIPSA